MPWRANGSVENLHNMLHITSIKGLPGSHW